MLISRIIKRKKVLINKLGKEFNDLIHGTFRFPINSNNVSMAAVNEYEKMRPDLVADRIYGDATKWDALLKYNGISNPFSISTGDLLYVIPSTNLDAVYVNPRYITEREQKEEGVINLLGEDSNIDSNRTDNLVKKAGRISSNFTKEGDKNVKIKDGRLIFGEDVTTVNKDNCPVPISRAKLKAALLKDKLFI